MNIARYGAAGEAYAFHPMRESDLPLVRQWLVQPHVAEWWGNPDEQYEIVRGDLHEPAMDQFIVAFDRRPFGYIQSYDLDAWTDDTFRALPSGTRAIDQFIGDPDMINRGHGSAFIRALVDQLLAAGAPSVMTDPAVENSRAVRAYEKAGFENRGLVATTDGPALLMVRNS